MKTVFFSAAALAAVFGATAAQADTTIYNSAPAAGWNYGSGNNYTPSNSAVLTTDADDQLSLRFHQTYVNAPASTGNLYSFTLGLPVPLAGNPASDDQLSIDWGIYAPGFADETAFYGNVSAFLTLTNLGTGVSVLLDPLSLAVHDDTAFGGGLVSNSYRLNWANGIAGGFFDPNVDNTYRAKLDVFGLAGGDKSLFVDAQVGAGAPAVPEPATWAMMLLGMGLVGATMRRKAKAGVRVRYA